MGSHEETLNQNRWHADRSLSAQFSLQAVVFYRQLHIFLNGCKAEVGGVSEGGSSRAPGDHGYVGKVSTSPNFTSTYL